MLRSLVFLAVFYINTAVFLVLGSWLLLAPRRCAMVGLRLHGARKPVVAEGDLRHALSRCAEREKLPKGAYLVASKHQSAWDTFALIPVFPDPAMVMKAELGWIPLYGWFWRKFEHIFVSARPRTRARSRASMRDAESAPPRPRDRDLSRGHASRRPVRRPTTSRASSRSTRGSALPCVPLALNSGLFWPRRSIMRYPGTIIIEVLDPIPPGLQRAEARKLIEERIETACDSPDRRGPRCAQSAAAADRD